MGVDTARHGKIAKAAEQILRAVGSSYDTVVTAHTDFFRYPQTLAAEISH